MVLDIFEEGVVGVGDLLLEVAVVSVPVFFLQLLHLSKTARLDLCQRFQSPSWPSLRHSAMKTAVTWVLDELERNQKEKNHLNSISKMMGTLVQPQLYTFNYREALFRP